MKNSNRDEIMEAQKEIAGQAEALRRLFSQIDGLLNDMPGAGDRKHLPVADLDLRLEKYLILLEKAGSELLPCKRLLETLPETEGEKASVRVSVMQAEQLLLAIERERAVLTGSLDDLKTLRQVQKQSEDAAAVTAVKHFQDALRRYSDEQEKDS